MNSSATCFRIGVPIALVLSLGFAACSGSGSSSAVLPATGCSSGQPFSMQVFADPFHTQQQCEFDLKTSASAYVYTSNVAPSDTYVMYVQSTGPNPHCVYMRPQRPTGGSNGLCNPKRANVTGINAPGGTYRLPGSSTRRSRTERIP